MPRDAQQLEGFHDALDELSALCVLAAFARAVAVEAEALSRARYRMTANATSPMVSLLLRHPASPLCASTASVAFSWWTICYLL